MQNEIYKTRDIYLASFLVMSGYPLASLIAEDKRFSFIFKKTDDMQTNIDTFYASKARVEPMEYSLAMKQIKSQMYNNFN